MKLTPLVKGLITGGVMAVVAVLLSFTKSTADDMYAYIIYGIYAAGVFWTLHAFSKSENYAAKFGAIFGQGFRCFVVVTLIMVVFTGVYSKMHPEYREQSTQLYKADLIKAKSKTPAEIDVEVARYKKGFTTSLVSMATFGYLVLGVFFTAAGAGILLMRRK